MTQQEIVTQLETFVRSRFEIAPDDKDFNADVHLFDYGYLDSFGAQELIAFVEKTFSTKVTDNDLIKFPLNTLNEIAAFVTKKNQP